MRLEQLRYLKTICQHRSLSQAAQILYLNQPTLSRSITALEKELDVQLFDRTHQGITPTEICRQLLPHFEQILTEMATIEAKIAAEKSKDISATLVISAGTILCNNVLLDISTDFNRSYPRVAIDIWEEYYLDIINHVCTGQAHIGFITSVHDVASDFFELLKQNQLVYEFLLQTPTMAVLPSVSPLAKQAAVTLAQLQDLPLFLHKKVQSALSPEIDSAEYHYCLDRESRNKMILKQQGYSVVSQLEMLDDFYVQQGLLVLRPIIDEASYGRLDLGIIYRQDHVWKFYEEDFITLARRYLANLVLK